MRTYEATDHNINMLVERQEEPCNEAENFYIDVYAMLDITEKCFEENIDIINNDIEDYLNNNHEVYEEKAKEIIESKLK